MELAENTPKKIKEPEKNKNEKPQAQVTTYNKNNPELFTEIKRNLEKIENKDKIKEIQQRNTTKEIQNKEIQQKKYKTKKYNKEIQQK